MPTTAEWLVFLGATTLFALAPGPGLVYVLARSLRGGRSEGVRSALGNSIGALLHVVAAAFGLSAVLATSATAFTAVKFAGAAYLCYLGVRALLNRDGGPTAASAPTSSARSALGQGVLTELFNPKTALWFLAFLPHFVHPERGSVILAFLVLGVVAVAMASTADIVVALLAGPIGRRLAAHPAWQRRQRVATGLAMIGLGGWIVTADN